MNFKIVLFLVFCLGFAVCSFAENRNAEIWQTKSVEQWTKVLYSVLKNPQSKTPTVREQWYAAYALGKYGTEAKSAVPVLLERLALDAGEDDSVRACILYTLAEIGDSDAVPAILESVDSPYEVVQRTAVLALRKFPEKLAEAPEVLKKLESILTTHEPTELALVTNCAVALWLVGKKEPVLTWLWGVLEQDGEFTYARNTEIYQALAAIHLILMDSGAETFGEETEHLAETLTELIQKTPDADSALSACEILVKLGPVVLPTVTTVSDAARNARLLAVLAELDSENESTQNLLLETMQNVSGSPDCRIAAIRGFLFFPEARQKEVVDVLVAFLNDSATDSVLANEARLVLKKLGKGNAE